MGCTHQINLGVSVSPKNFKIQTPFILTNRGIIINTYWGTDKRHHVLCLDNYSPSWINSALIKYDKSFSKSKDYNFNTSTADGTPIHGNIGICDSLTFENVTFTKAPFYVMQHKTEDNTNDDGVFGSELMSKGIWKIDFKQNEPEDIICFEANQMPGYSYYEESASQPIAYTLACELQKIDQCIA